VNQRCGLALPEEDFDTLGGYVFGALGRVPDVGDVVPVQGQGGPMELRVEGTEDRRVTRVRLAQPAPVAAEPA
jgi:putative hemolysin